MSNVDTSTWNPDPALNESIGDIPLNESASIEQTWQAIQMLMAALKGDTAAIELTINQPDGTTIVATNQMLTVVDNGHAHTISNVSGLQTALNGKATNAGMAGATASADGASGLVPAPEAGDQDKVLKGDGTWDDTPIPNLGTASRAVQTDADGALVASSVSATELGYLLGVTSAIQTQLNSKSADSSVVHLSGNESIAGDKTFTSNIHCRKGTSIFLLEGTGSSSYQDVRFVNASGSADVIEAAVRHLNGGDLQIGNKYSGGTGWLQGPMLQLKSDGSFTLRAYAGAEVALAGSPDGTLTWGGQPIQTSSDERLKTPLFVVPDAVLDAWEDVNWGQFQFLDAVERKGEAARLHLGLIAQKVKAIFEERGLDVCRYGILCRGDDGYWTVRYAEASVMEALCQRRRADRLEARIKVLEEALNG